jgi:hypothetical protein
MKLLSFLVALLFLVSCSSEEEYANQPVAPWTYPISEYHVIKTQVARKDRTKLTRLVGWDEGFYFFDWSHAGEVIGRGTGRVAREQFDVENGGALTLEKGQVTLRNGQIRTLMFE